MKELVGKGKPFYSAVDKAAALLKRKVGTGAEFMKELQGLGGIKQSEIEERGLGEIMGMPKMTHEQFMAALAAKPAPAIHEKVLGAQVQDTKVRNQAWEQAYENGIDHYLDNGFNPDDARRLALEYADKKLHKYLPKNVEPEYPTYHGEYTLPGGSNYREMLIKAPPPVDNQEKIMELEAKARRIPMINSTPEQQAELTNLFGQIKQLKEQEKQQQQFPGVKAHFNGEPGILASMRVKDRTGPNGEKLLHLEELQSDWHQQGRESGYKRPETGGLPELKEGWKYEDFNGKIGIRDPRGILVIAVDKPEDAIRYIRENSWAKPNNGVPDAPFKKNWEEMALKRLIHHAAEKGYHGIVVTPGQEQADRYSLANHISGVDYIRNELKPQRNEMVAYDPRGNVIYNEFGVTPEKLEQHIGKEAAQKLLSQEAQPNKYGMPTHSLRGEQLILGGRGMKKFYDEKVPNILNAIGKKYGVKTHLHGHELKVKDPDREPQQYMMGTGLHGVEYNGDLREFPTQEEANQYIHNATHKKVHHFPITEEMRKDVLTNGLPLHKEGGIIHKAVGGQVQPSINAMRAELAKKMPTSLADLSSIGANEAPSMNVKAYVPPARNGEQLPVGGIDMNDIMKGIQFMPEESQAMSPQQPPQGGQPQGMPSPLGGGAPPAQPPSNILQMTPQGQALNAIRPPQAPAKMAVGGSVPMPYKVGGSDNMTPKNDGWKQDNGVTTFNIDNVQQVAEGGSIGNEDDTTVMTHDHGYADGGLVPEEMEPPKKTVKAYKLFRVHKKHPGKLFPLFVNADKPVEMDKWQQAEIGEMAGKKVKSKIGPLAFRPGWHAGDLPIATHIGEKDEEQKMEQARIRELRNKAIKKHGNKKLANQTYPYPEWTNAPRLRNPNHVWAEVEMPNDKNWQKEADKRGMNAQGKIVPKNAHITDQIPHGGHYRYKTNSNMKGNWLIGGGMKVNRILSDDEVKAINKAAGAKDLPRAKKQNLADYGFADGGSAKKLKYTPPGMGRSENEPPLPRVSPMSKAQIEQIALRMAPQIAGQYTPESEKSQKQFAREQTLKHDIQPIASPLNPVQDVDLAKHKDKVMVGLPGDYTITNQELRKVAGKKLKYPVVQQGGSRYGETHPNSIWASQEEAAQNMMNLAKSASRQYGDADVLANHIKMGPDSAYYAKHYVRAMLSAIESARLSPQQKDELTQMLREKEFGYGLFPNAPHVKNIKDIYSHVDFDPDFRRHVGALMNRKYATDPYGIISGADMLHATSEPELRNLETGVTGHSIGELHFNKPLTTSTHSTYSHDIPGKFLGKLPVPVPYELSFPDAVNALRTSKNPEHKKALFGTLKMFGARQKIDQQLIDELGQYRNMIKKLTGKKNGGKVKLSTNMDTINLELSRRTKKAK